MADRHAQSTPALEESPRRAGPKLAALASLLAAAGPIIFGGLIVKLAAIAVLVGVLKGLWRGGAEVLGIVAGLGLALPAAIPSARLLDGLTHAALGTTGLTNRLLTITVVATVITTIGGIAGKLVARRLLRASPALRRCNPYLGAVLGAVEGSLFALMILWAPLALEPIARIQMAEPDAGGEPRAASFPAVGLAQAADAIRESVLGPIVEATNPFGSSDLLAIAADFAAVSRDPDAMRFFMNTAVMQKIGSLPSVTRAREIIESDPDLSRVLGKGGVSVDELKTVMDSPTVLRIFDETSVVADLQPLEPDLLDAIRRARARVRVGSNGR